MKYLKYFEQASAYEAYKNGSDFVTPNVSYAKDNNTVYYNPSNTDAFVKTKIYVTKDEGFFVGPENSCWWEFTNRTITTDLGTMYIWECDYLKNEEMGIYIGENDLWYALSESPLPSNGENIKSILKSDVDSGNTNNWTMYGWVSEII